MFRFSLLLVSMLIAASSFAQLIPKPQYGGFYFQWGYNRDRYSKSTIHFWEEGKYDFTLHKVTARDRPDFDGFRTNPIDITIPQNSVRLGFYLNKEQTHAIELNFDHAKYVVDAYQTVRMTGEFNGNNIDADTVLAPWFIDFEHSNGANFLLLNYVGQHEILRNKKRKLASCVWKVGAGIVIPRSDVRINAKRVDNVYHVAGYIAGVEGGLRFYVLKHMFLEATGKMGFADYRDVLTIDAGKASHNFFYGEIIGLLGYDLHRPKNKKQIPN